MILRGVPRFPVADHPGLYEEALHLTLRIKRPDDRSQVLAEVLPFIDAARVADLVSQQLSVVFDLVKNDNHMVHASIKALAPFLTLDQITLALPLARSIIDRQMRARTLLALAMNVPGPAGDEILNEAHLVTAMIDGDSLRQREVNMIVGAGEFRTRFASSGISRESIISAARVAQAANTTDGIISEGQFEFVFGISKYHIFKLFPTGRWTEVLELMQCTDNLAADLRPLGRRSSMTSSGIRIFVSHSKEDKKLAESLVEYLTLVLEIEARQIRCTSVDGYKHSPGDHTSIRLRNDLAECTAVIGLVTPDSLKSSWVLFELGAGWGMEKLVLALLSPEIEPKQLPGPLNERQAGKISDSAYLYAVLDRLGEAEFKMSDNQPLKDTATKKLIKADQLAHSARKRRMASKKKSEELSANEILTVSSSAAQGSMSDIDCSVKLRGWFKSLSSDQKVTSYEHSVIDQQLNLPTGATHRLIAQALQEEGFVLSGQGDLHFIARPKPLKLQVAGMSSPGLMKRGF